MAKYERFEDFPVWNLAADLAAFVFQWTTRNEFRGKGDLASQLQRSILSISNNIAEGFESGTTAELLRYLDIARASAGESRSMLCVMQRTFGFESVADEIQSLQSQLESVSRQIRAWANSLQNSDIQGQRHLTDESREKWNRQQRQSRYLDELAKSRQELEAKLKREAKERASQCQVESLPGKDSVD